MSTIKQFFVILTLLVIIIFSSCISRISTTKSSDKIVNQIEKRELRSNGLTNFDISDEVSQIDVLKEKGTKIRIASYNIRVAAASDEQSGNGWSIRKNPLADLIRRNDFDIVGTQEGNFSQMKDLNELLPEYSYIAYPYAGVNSNSHTACILYKTNKYDIIDHGVFWLSQTPHEQSIGWDASDTRICSWAKMKDISSGQKFYYFVVHFYWRNVTARQNSGPLVVQMIEELADKNIPIICSGDFNSVDTTSQIQAIKKTFKDSYEVTENSPYGPEGTNLGGGNFHGEPKGRIDYVFVNRLVKVVNYVTLTCTYDNSKHPSDHLPVVCDLLLFSLKI
jgi:endonuclease/exonuclease/phosphatase family metal-dependent hydrolase